MATGNYEFQSDFHKKADALGRARGKASAVLTVLEARGIAISNTSKDRILACTDLELLDRWLRKAATITSADELFTD